MGMGIITLLNLCRKKVTDSIGVTKESVLQISCQLTLLCIGPVASSLVPSYIDINLWNGFFVVTLFGFFPLVMAFVSIQNATKHRGSHSVSDTDTDSEDTDGIPRKSSKLSVQNYSEDGLKVNDDISPSNARSNSTQIAQLQLKNMDSNALKKGLAFFLKDNVHNFALFANYLTECFCLENLLFLERAIVLFHAIKQRNGGNCEDKMFKTSCYGLRFNFLHQIQSDVDAMIDASDDDKRGILAVMRMIFAQFINSSSATEINVSYPVHNALVVLFDKSDDQILEELSTYDELMRVYHWAIKEAWNMCVSVYGFQFKSYVRKHKVKHRSNVENELSLSLVCHDTVIKMDNGSTLQLPKISEHPSTSVASISSD